MSGGLKDHFAVFDMRHNNNVLIPMIHVVTPTNMRDSTGSTTQPLTSFTCSKSTTLQFLQSWSLCQQNREAWKTRHSKTFWAGCLPLQLVLHNHSHDLTQSLVSSVKFSSVLKKGNVFAGWPLYLLLLLVRINVNGWRIKFLSSQRVENMLRNNKVWRWSVLVARFRCFWANTPDREDDDEGAMAVKRNEDNWRGL